MGAGLGELRKEDGEIVRGRWKDGIYTPQITQAVCAGLSCVRVFVCVCV